MCVVSVSVCCQCVVLVRVQCLLVYLVSVGKDASLDHEGAEIVVIRNRGCQE